MAAPPKDRRAASKGRRGRAARRWAKPRRAILLVLGAVAALLLVEGLVALVSVHDARSDQAELTRALNGTDVAAARAAAESMTRNTGRARSMLSGPQWALPEAVPWVGDDLRALRFTVRTLDDAMQHSALPVVQVLVGLRGRNGGVDTGEMSLLQPVLDSSASRAEHAASQIHRINVNGLVRPLRPPVQQAAESLDRLARLTATARDGLTVGRAVFGLDQPSTTLLAVQNPAELRGTGGIMGAWAVISSQDGALKVTSTGVNDPIFPYRAKRSAVPGDVLATYGDAIRHVANVNLTPDFPRAAQLLLSSFATYAAAVPSAPQLPPTTQVVTLTPHALAALIGVTGPLPLPGTQKEVTAANAANLFMNDIYSIVPDDTQRSIAVQRVMQDVFAAIQAPGTDSLGVARALADAARTRDLMLWSPSPNVQSAAERLGLSGGLPSPDGTSLVVTTVSSDAAKLDFYLRESIELDRPSRTLTVRLRNDAPAEVAPYVGVQDPDPGEAVTGHDVTLQVHLPPAIGVRGARLNGKAVELAVGAEGDWHVVRRGLRVLRETTMTLTFELEGPAESVRNVMTQPMAQPPTVLMR